MGKKIREKTLVFMGEDIDPVSILFLRSCLVFFVPSMI